MDRITETLDDELQSGRLHPKIPVHGLTLAKWLSTETNQRDESSVRILRSVVESRLRYSTINDELQELVGRLNRHHVEVLIARYGRPQQTLQDIGDKLGLTRERIRQLQSKAARKVRQWLRLSPPWRLQTALLLAEEMGSQISFSRWKEALAERNLIAKLPIRDMNGKSLSINSLNFALAVLRANEDDESSVDAFRIPENLHLVLDYPGFTADEIEASRKLSKQELRAIRRQCRNAGAVSVILLSRKLKTPTLTIRKTLALRGYMSLNEEWLASTPRHGTPVGSRYSAFQANVIKMLGLCGPLPLEMVRQGLQNHASRFDFAVPPTTILEKLLSLYHFKMDGNRRVLPVKGVKIVPNGSERIVLSLIKELGPVVNFQELSEEFRRKKRSQPALSGTLRHSVLLQRVDSGLYSLRGAKITREDVEAALARRLKVEQDGMLRFSADGVITWEINMGTFGIGGTIPAGAAARLAGQWDAVVGKTGMGHIKVGDQQIWGLAKAFRKLGVKVGDRVALHFNTRTRRVQIVKVRSRDEQDQTD